MVNTTNGGSDNNTENIENATTTNDNDIFIKMYEDFANQNKGDPVFLDNLFSNSNYVLTQLKEFKKKDEYKDLSDDKIKTTWLQLKFKGDYVKIKNNRKLIEKKIKRDYDVSDSFYSQKIKTQILDISYSGLKVLLISEKLDIFLGDILKTNKPKKRDFTNLFNLLFKDLNLSSFSSEEQEDVKAVFAYLELNHPEGQFNKISDSDLFEIFSIFRLLGVSKRIKKKFLEKYCTKISLVDYKKIFNINNNELLLIKEKLIIQNFPEFNNLDDFDKKRFINGIDDSSIFFNTSDLIESQLNTFFSDEENTNKIGKLFQKDYNDQIDGLNKNTEDNILNEAGVSNEGINTDKLKDFFGKLGEDVDFSKFIEGNIIELDIIESSTSSKDNETSIEKSKLFLKIEKIDLDRKIIKYYDNTSGGLYNPSKSGGLETTSFGDFLAFVKNQNKTDGLQIKSISFNTEKDIQTKIKNGDIDPFNNTLIQESTSDLTKDEAKKRLIQQGIKDEDITDEQIDNYILTESKRINELNYESLKASIDKIDLDGKGFGLDENTTFVASDNNSFYTISEINKTTSTISLFSAGSNKLEFVSFIDFNATYKELECRRKSGVSKIDDLLTNVSDDLKVWKGFKIKDNKILKKSTNDEKEGTNTNIEYNYLVTDNDKDFVKGRNVIRIESIDGDKANITLGSIEEFDDTKKDDKKTVYGMEKSSIQVSLSVLEAWIKKSKMRPESLKSHKDTIEQKHDNTLNRKTNLVSKFFSGTSFNEMIKAGEFWFESVKNFLEEGNEEHAARFAEKYLGKVLPKGIQLDLKSRSEAAQKKRMDDYMQRFKDLDSGDATELVKRLLMNKSAPEPQKEAAMIFMMESYGSLYTKKALFPLRGQFLWYRAMGGKVGDALFVKEKERAEGPPPVQFTEEDLIYSLISAQCKDKLPPKRRGRLYKEVEALIGKGREEEFEKGKKDAEKKRTINRRVDFAIDELKSGSYPNAMGAFEEIVGKGDDGNQTKLNKVPFVMAFSGLAYDFDQKMVDNFKNNPTKGLPVMSTMFMSVPPLIGVFSDTVKELSWDLSQIYPGKYPDMYTDALKIYNKQQDSSDQTKKVEETVVFFDKYGEVLTRSMNMLMTGKTDDLTKTDQIILLKKDEPGKGAYKEYYNTFKGFLRNNTNFSNEELLTDAFMSDDGNGSGSGIIGMDTYNVAKDTLIHIQGGGFRLGKAGPQIWKGFIYAIDEVVNSDYSSLGNNNEIKKKIIKDKLRGLLAGLIEGHGSNANAIKGFMTGTSPFFMKFNEWGIIPSDFLDNNISGNRLLDDKDVVANNLLDKYVNNVLSGKSNSSDYNFTIPKVTEEVKGNIDGTIN